MESPSRSLSVAIVGSGPSGCYLAHSLRRARPDAEITIFDRLVSPYGLVRYGVAADHQHTKNIIRQFDRLFEREDVRFAGNIEIGADLTLEQLRRAYTVVAFATGLGADRPLGIPGADLPGVYGAGTLVRVLNSEPRTPTAFPDLGERVVLIGGGNVAIDVVRFLAKTPDHFELSDIDEDALASYAAAPATRVEVVSRSPIATAKSDPVMLRELGKLPGVRFRCDDDLDVPDGADRAATARSAAVRSLSEMVPEQPVRAEIVFRFGWTPVRIEGDDRVRAVVLADPSGATQHLEADSVIGAIGFELAGALDGVVEDVALDPEPSTGRLGDRLYRTGWLKRGPRGTIPDNRSCAQAVADEILADVDGGVAPVREDQLGFAGLPADVRERAVDFAAWRKVDAAELAAAPTGRIRRKIPDHTAMLDIARG